MSTYKVKKINEIRDIEVGVPGSKSITNRALLLAAMSNDVCKLSGVLFCDDSIAMIECLKDLGFEINVDEVTNEVVVRGENGRVPKNEATINVGSAGTAARFMTAFLSVVGGDYTLDASEQMKKRPMIDFLKVLEAEGVEIKYLEEEGHFPFEIHSKGLSNVSLSIDTSTSTQYASALLLVGAICGMALELKGGRIDGSYIKITLHMLRQFGIDFVGENNFDESATYRISKQDFSMSDYKVEPDMSSACYFYALAMLLRSKAKVEGVHLDSMQGDIKFVYVLERLGAKVTDTADGLEVDATEVKSYDGIEIDMKDFSDQAMTMAIIAAFANGTTVIKNIGHTRKQESDRVTAMVNELNKIGCDAKVIEHDGQTDVSITPNRIVPAEIETYEDHRVAMSFTLAGLVVDGMSIKNPECVRKTFANYYEIIEKL